MLEQTDGHTDGRTPYHYTDPAPHTMWALPTKDAKRIYITVHFVLLSMGPPHRCDVAYCYRCNVVCLSVCVSLGHEHELCANGRTDRDVVRDSWGHSSGVGTMGTEGTLYPPSSRLVPYPLYSPRQRCGLCQNFKQRLELQDCIRFVHRGIYAM